MVDDDVVALITSAAERGVPRGAAQVLSDARAGTLSLGRLPNGSPSSGYGQFAIAVACALVLVGSIFAIERNGGGDEQPDFSTPTVLDDVAVGTATGLCQALGPLVTDARESQQTLAIEELERIVPQLMIVAANAREQGASQFADSIIEFATALARQVAPYSNNVSPTPQAMNEFRLVLARKSRAESQLKLSCIVVGVPLDGIVFTDDQDSPATTATR